jgi:hypothetical protein
MRASISAMLYCRSGSSAQSPETDVPSSRQHNSSWPIKYFHMVHPFIAGNKMQH